jgi:hypothetical protein
MALAVILIVVPRGLTPDRHLRSPQRSSGNLTPPAKGFSRGA